MIKKAVLVSFDKTERTFCESVRPEKYDDILKLKTTPFIARGAGLSYCNAGATNRGLVIDMRRMNKILAFDAENGDITAEAGLSIGELNNFLISKGFIFPVLPGYPSITLGGCVAFNVHGKSQFRYGNFGDWIRALQLYHPTHGELKCDSNQNTNVFHLTIGGMGLTGVIMTVSLKSVKLSGGRIQTTRKFTKNLDESVQMMKDCEKDYDYVYSWNNLNKNGNSFGEGVVYLEKYVPGDPTTVHYSDRTGLSFRLPAIHSKFSVRIMCAVYYLLEKLKSRISTQELTTGTFPIYNKEIYYNLFGRKGFREYQLLVSFEKYPEVSRELQMLIRKHRIAVALGSLKLFHGKNHHLSFTGTGVCLTLDVAESNGVLPFFSDLDAMCIKHAAIINLSKDSRVPHDVVEKLFSNYDEFKQAIHTFDPNHCISSELKKRLKLES